MPDRSLLLVFAHPDDESFATGGAVALATAAGIPTYLVTATAGDAGRAGGLADSTQELGVVRERELREACSFLGVREHVLLGYGDGRLAEAPFDEAVGRVVGLVRRWRPSVVVTFGREGGANAHRDHRAICRIATAAVLAAGEPDYAGSSDRTSTHSVDKHYFVTAKAGMVARGGEPFDLPTTSVDISSVVARKIGAFALHASQRSLLPRLEEWIADNGDAEHFVRAFSRVRVADGLETDLFAGLDDA